MCNKDLLSCHTIFFHCKIILSKLLHMFLSVRFIIILGPLRIALCLLLVLETCLMSMAILNLLKQLLVHIKHTVFECFFLWECLIDCKVIVLLLLYLTIEIFTFLAKCIDHYTQQRVKIYEGVQSKDGKPIVIEPKLEAVVNRMFQRCFDDGKYKQVNK